MTLLTGRRLLQLRAAKRGALTGSALSSYQAPRWPIAMCAERGPVCLGDRAWPPPQIRSSTDRAWTVTRVPAVVESKSRFDRAEPARSCSGDTAACQADPYAMRLTRWLVHSPVALLPCIDTAEVQHKNANQKGGPKMGSTKSVKLNPEVEARIERETLDEVKPCLNGAPFSTMQSN